MTSTAELSRTPLYNWHASHGARMVDFAGWSMPVQYTSIVEEHQATRTGAGAFDISHMGRLAVTGPDAATFLDCLLTRRVTDMRPGMIHYSLICNADGGILDDVLVYRRQDDRDEPQFSLVVNASNRAKIVDWLKDRVTEFAARVAEDTLATAMIALQGPRAAAIADKVSGGAIGKLKNYRGMTGTFAGVESYLSRTGYTGEDGCEIICTADAAPAVWGELLEHDVQPCGLGARDTLRLEAAMPLYGHELDESINPIQAGLRFAVNMKEREFIGRDALAAVAADPRHPIRVGLHIEERRVARQGAAVQHGRKTVGEVTSGTFSPTLERPIAMAYVHPESAATGTHVDVDIRGKTVAAVVVPLPFYQRS